MSKSSRDFYCIAAILFGIFSTSAYSVTLPQAPNNSFSPGGSANDVNIQFLDQIQIQNMQHQLLTNPCQGGQWSQCNPDTATVKESINHAKSLND